jgi:chemotaxis protein MotB
VAYADFVTAMMAFFMVMWLVGQNAETKEAVQEYFQNPTVQLLPAWVSRGPHEHGGGAKHQNVVEVDELENDSVDKKNKRIRADEVRHARLLVRTDGDSAFAGTIVLFGNDSAELDDDAKTGLHQLVPLLSGKTNLVEIRGHAERRRPDAASKFPDDWQLSFARSMAVMRYLEDAGIEAQRIRLSQTSSLGPQSANQGEAISPARVEIYLLSEFVDASPEKAHDAYAPHFGDETQHPEAGHEGHGLPDNQAGDSHASTDDHNVKAPPKRKAGAKPKASGHGGGHGKPPAKSKASSHGGGHGKPATKQKASSHGKKPAAKSSHGGH